MVTLLRGALVVVAHGDSGSLRFWLEGTRFGLITSRPQLNPEFSFQELNVVSSWRLIRVSNIHRVPKDNTELEINKLLAMKRKEEDYVFC